MWFYLAVSTIGQLFLWPAFARIHYRTWEWDAKTGEQDRRTASGFWGFVWPLYFIVLVLVCVFRVIGLAETAPSLKQRREKREQDQAQKRKALPQRIKDAERELEEARREQEQIQRP